MADTLYAIEKASERRILVALTQEIQTFPNVFTDNNTFSQNVNIQGNLTAAGIDGNLNLIDSYMTTGTMNYAAADKAMVSTFWHKFTWTNAMVVALGAATDGDITVCTVPAGYIIERAYIKVLTQAVQAAGALTATLGRTGAGYVDILIASDLKAVAGTIYGATAAECGAGVTVDEQILITTPTAVKSHFNAAGANLSTVTACTGEIYLKVSKLW